MENFSSFVENIIVWVINIQIGSLAEAGAAKPVPWAIDWK